MREMRAPEHYRVALGAQEGIAATDDGGERIGRRPGPALDDRHERRRTDARDDSIRTQTADRSIEDAAARRRICRDDADRTGTRRVDRRPCARPDQTEKRHAYVRPAELIESRTRRAACDSYHRRVGFHEVCDDPPSEP